MGAPEREFCIDTHLCFYHYLLIFFEQPRNLQSSGIELVLSQTMYAIIGAVSLEKGGHIANKVAQERILEPLGIKTSS